MLSTLLIVFREIIEAGLIVGVVLAATRGVSGRGLWVWAGIAGGVLGACLVAAFADKLGALFQGSGQEMFNATILVLAVVMLTWHNVWMSSHGRAMARDLRRVGDEVRAGNRTLAAMAVVVGVAVLREGSEIVLFLYGIAVQGGTSNVAMLIGGALGLAAGAAVTAMMYFGLLVIPAHRLFSVTSGLITLLAAGMAAQAILFIQNGGWLNVLTTPVWDTSWLLSNASIPGRLLHTLVGYTQEPNGAQLIAYGATVFAIILLTRVAGGRKRMLEAKPA